jgi:DNA-binding MarR family transcriptional regulator
MIDMGTTGEQPLGYLLHRVAAALRAEVAATVLEPMGLSFPEYICMRMLSHAPGKSNAELARDAGVSPQAMNMVLRALQDRELVARPAVVASGRSLPAELTGRGTVLLKRIDPGIRQAEQRVLGRLGEPDRREFRRLLAMLA